ncbi:hypothetical protein AKO1_002880, partial [Acrasis kona]
VKVVVGLPVCFNYFKHRQTRQLIHAHAQSISKSRISSIIRSKALCWAIVHDDFVAVASEDIYIYKISDGSLIRVIKVTYNSIHSMVALGDSLLICFYASTNCFRIFDWRLGELTATIICNVCGVDPLHKNMLVYNNRYMISNGQKLGLWDLKTCRVSVLTKLRHVTCLEYGFEDDSFLCGMSNGSLRVASLQGFFYGCTTESHAGAVSCITLISKNKFASAGRDSFVYVWDSQLNLCRKIKTHYNLVTCLSPISGDYFCTASGDSKICVWDSISGEFVCAIHEYSAKS